MNDEIKIRLAADGKHEHEDSKEKQRYMRNHGAICSGCVQEEQNVRGGWRGNSGCTYHFVLVANLLSSSPSQGRNATQTKKRERTNENKSMYVVG